MLPRRALLRWRLVYAQAMQLYRPVVRLQHPRSPPTARGYAHELNPQFLVERKGLKARVLDGNKLADTINQEMQEEIKIMAAEGKRAPHLVAVLVGGDPASQKYVSNKTKAAEKCGMKATTLLEDCSVSQEALLKLVDRLNLDPGVDGVLVQVPLPSHIDEQAVMQTISPSKDVDGFHIENIGRYCSGNPGSALIPATPLGVLEIIKRCNVPTFGKTVCIANRSKNVGFTLNTLLHSDTTGDATVLQTHRYTPPEQLAMNTRQADIIIVGCGIPGLITADMVKEGAAVIDIGITRITTASGKQKIVGDVDFHAVAQKASVITPVPGGVGPLTVAMVIRNTLYIAQNRLQFNFSTIYEDK